MPDLSVSALQAQVQKLMLALRKYVPIDGNTTIIGRLFVSNDPRGDLEVATKHYVDVKNSSAGAGTTTVISESGIQLTDSLGNALSNVTALEFAGLILSGNSSAAVATATGSSSTSSYAPIYVEDETPVGSLNGSNTSFTIANTPNVGSFQLFLNGLRQRTSMFSQSGTLLTISTPPHALDDVSCFYTYGSTSSSPSSSPSSTQVYEETPSGTINGSNTSFTLLHIPISGTIELYLNGVLQRLGAGYDYQSTSASLTFTIAPISGDTILVNYKY